MGCRRGCRLSTPFHRPLSRSSGGCGGGGSPRVQSMAQAKVEWMCVRLALSRAREDGAHEAPRWGCSTQLRALERVNLTPPPLHPLLACATDSTRGEGRDGKPPPRGAPWEAFATSGAAWPPPSREGLQGASRQAPAAPQSLWALWGGLAAWHADHCYPAVVGAQAFTENTPCDGRPTSTQPPRGAAGWNVGLCPYKGVFSRGHVWFF